MRFVAAPHFAYFKVLNGMKQTPGPKTEKNLKAGEDSWADIAALAESEVLRGLVCDCEHCEAEAG